MNFLDTGNSWKNRVFEVNVWKMDEWSVKFLNSSFILLKFHEFCANILNKWISNKKYIIVDQKIIWN